MPRASPPSKAQCLPSDNKSWHSTPYEVPLNSRRKRQHDPGSNTHETSRVTIHRTEYELNVHSSNDDGDSARSRRIFRHAAFITPEVITSGHYNYNGDVPPPPLPLAVSTHVKQEPVADVLPPLIPAGHLRSRRCRCGYKLRIAKRT